MLLARIRVSKIARLERRLDGSGGSVRMLRDRTGGMRFASLVERNLIVAGCRMLVRHITSRMRVVVAVHRAIGMFMHMRMRYRHRSFALCCQNPRFNICRLYAFLFVRFTHACLRYPR